MEIFVVGKANEEQNSLIFDKYLRARHRIYADELQWVPPASDGRELDKYDTDAAVHFIGIEDGEVIAGSRLVPTHQPHLLGDVFPYPDMVSSPYVAEWTRGFVIQERRAVGDFRIHYAFCHAIMDFALAEGLRQVGGIQRTYWMAMWMRMKWKVHVRGEPIDIDGDPWCRMFFDVSEDALAGAAKRAKAEKSLLRYEGEIDPFVHYQVDHPAPFISAKPVWVTGRDDVDRHHPISG